MKVLMGSANLCNLHKKVAQLYSGQLDEWVCASVGSIYCTGGSYTYVGCSRAVYGATASQSWLCRKKLSVYDTFPEECVNHGYRHEGKCCSLDEGVKCYRFSLRLVDQSGELEALIWAPAIHLLAVPPEEFDTMTTEQKEQVFQSLQGKEWRFNILSVVDELGFRHFKVQFLLPAEKAYVLKTSKALGEVIDLPKIEALTLTQATTRSLDSSKFSTPVVGKRQNSNVETETPSSKEEMDFALTKSDEPDNKEVAMHLQTSLESLVGASQQNAKAIEQLALAVAEIQKKIK